LFAVAPGDVAKRFVGGNCLRVNRLCILRTWKRLLQFPRFYFSTIFRSKNLGAL